MRRFLSMVPSLLFCLVACSPAAIVTPTPIPEIPHTGILRVAYSKLADPWIWTEGEGSRQLADSVNVMEVVISSDGQVVAFKRDDTGEILAVNTDGSGLHTIVNATFLSQLNAAVWAFDFAPKSHQVFFTLEQAGNSFQPFYDLYRVDVDITDQDPVQFLPTGQGGIATFSPDGAWMSLYHPGSLDLIKTDGSAKRSIFTYPEGYEPATFGPEVFWMADSSGFTLFHTPDPVMNLSAGGLWFVPLEGEPQEWIPVESTWGVPSPDGQRLGFSTPGSPSEIHIIDNDGTDTLYLSPENGYFKSWAPDSQHFLIIVEEQIGGKPVNITYLCQLGEKPVMLTETGTADPVVWVTPSEFLYVTSGGDLRLKQLSEDSLLLDSQIYNVFDYVILSP